MTDILNEPDDSMSLVRYLLYSNEFDTRGICATTSWWLKNATHPDEIRKIINAYGEVVDNLNQHVNPNAPYPKPEDLISLITSGPAIYGHKALDQPVSEGAKHIISALQESEEPLYVGGWGGTNTLAQTLLHMDKTLSPSEAATLRSRIRLYTISDQDDTGSWIRARYPDVFYIVSIHSFNDYQVATWPGINLVTSPGVNSTVVLNPWLDAHIRLGPLGAMYPQVIYGMEGDTPSYLWLVQNGLGYRDRIDWGTWGGRYSRPEPLVDWEDGVYTNHFVDARDTGVIGIDGNSYSTNQATIWRWRSAYQDDFAARIRWTLTSNFSEVGHPPVLNINGQEGPDPVFIKTKGNETYTFDAGLTYDPDYPSDNSHLEFQWFLYPEATFFSTSALTSNVTIEALSPPKGSDSILVANDAGFSNVTLGSKVLITVPESTYNANTGLSNNFHVLLEVINKAGLYPIRRYQRLVFEYES
ncbi:DUF1593-domain-containing protein [Annulohypoxylon maeteangense]|uniref:DUF1593-domain-containing protein n=1 Tax=Annulohypoxylon maeteangense TaxID=1927788 RepID=UPI0020075C41|nr:DUF1593-domain-containing protein [Annulohypoxylon maeteangense]KAI0886339.1 DUF1593-domain-containing protein [Annulohypoxylon maeteangense]